MVHFRCCSTVRVENGFRLNATQVLSHTFEKVARSVAQRSINDIKDDKLKWRMMITFSKQAHRYSSLDLSYEKDRLPALAGLARNVVEVTGTPAAEYFVGLWLRTLFYDLIFLREDAYESWDDVLSCLGSRDKYVSPS